MHVIVILLCHLLVNQKVFMTQEINSMDEKEDSFKGEIDDYQLFQDVLDEHERELLEMLEFLEGVSKRVKKKADWRRKLIIMIEMLLNLKGELQKTRNICGIFIYFVMIYLCGKQIKKLVRDFECEWRSFEDDSDDDSSEGEWDSSDTEDDLEDFQRMFAQKYSEHFQVISFMNKSAAAGAA